ncbi:MAG: glycosyltransferase [Anaerolineaceae bacterium]|nr:glycosyltransferase [Anaerolineaceae bacterium]
MKVGILTSPFYKSYMVNYPLKAFSKQLRDENITCEFLYLESKKFFNYDVLIITADAFRNKLRKYNKLPDRHILLPKLVNKKKTIIWYDTEDSTGMTLFDVMPYVNLYVKNQIFKDKTQYLNQLYNERICSDYYHTHFGVQDNLEIRRPRLNPQYLNKIACAWNFGLNNYSKNVKSKLRHFHRFMPHHYKRISPISPKSLRSNEVSYHVSLHSDVQSVSFQRRMIYKLLQELKKERNYSILTDGVLSPDKYKKEISETAVIPSPFGFGEICPRDFEAFICGAALLKPDMSMIGTWPDYYIPNVTYVPFSWDFSDCKTKLIELLDNSEKRISIASQGQRNYLKSISQEGGRSFAKRFMSLLTLALDTKQ